MTRSYDDALVEYNSPAFKSGLDQGHEGVARLDEPADPDISDVEWASYCEGWLLGSSLFHWDREVPPEQSTPNEQKIADNIGEGDVFLGVTRYKRLEPAATEVDRDLGENATGLTLAETFGWCHGDS